MKKSRDSIYRRDVMLRRAFHRSRQFPHKLSVFLDVVCDIAIFLGRPYKWQCRKSHLKYHLYEILTDTGNLKL